MKEQEMDQIALWVDRVIQLVAPYCELKPAAFEEKIKSIPELQRIAEEVKTLCQRYPLNV
jgi:glycine/serine hydroxymethyltransferase